MPSVRVGAAEVAYDVQGPEGAEVVVLVHGSAGSRDTWRFQLPRLVEGWRVVLPELAGSGATVDPGGRLEVDGLAAQVLGVVDDVGAERVHLVGYSLGAVVALAAAATRPERVRSLALVCGWAVSDARMAFTFDLWRRLLAADPELFARYLLADGHVADWFEDNAAEVEALLPLVAAGVAPGTDRHAELDARVDVAHHLDAVAAPTLVVGGRHDRWVPVEHSRRIAAAIPGARLVELDAGHLVLSACAGELADLLADHVAAHAEGAGRPGRPT